MSGKKRLLSASLASVLGLGIALSPAFAAKKYDQGASDTEIKIGQSMPYSGPASAYGTIGKAQAAYFKMVNDQGGINGRKINFISVDDGYAPPRAVEQTRKLVEQEGVLLIFQTLGTPGNSAIHKYLNDNKIPHLFPATGASKWNDPKNFPWTMGWQPNYYAEGRAYAEYILKNIPNAKVGVLYQNDDYGKDYLKGFREGLGDKAKSVIVREVTYEVSDPTVDSQIVTLKGSGANVFLNVTTPKFAAQAIRKAAEIDWRPTQFVNNVSTNLNQVLKPAGLQNAKGIITAQYIKEVTDPQYQKDKDYQDWLAWMKKYNPDASLSDGNYVYGYATAYTLHQVLKAAGDELTRENIMKQAQNLKNLKVPLLIEGITVNTSATDHAPIEAVRLAKFNGEKWEQFGQVIGK